MSIADQRRQYGQQSFKETEVDRDPIAQFRIWLNEAEKAQLIDATSMTVVTATRDGRPSARVMLLKGVGEQGFVFYSNYGSRKGLELAENPQASLVFYWYPLSRQVRIEGTVEKLSRQQSQTYFDSRPRESQISALASRQSRVIESRQVLETESQRLRDKYAGQQVPLPDDWGGYVLKPRVIEFWQGRDNRMHDRLCYTLQSDSQWHIKRLAP